MDPDAEVLKAANAAVMEIDLRYRASTFDEQIDLKEARDAAFDAYAKARINLLQAGIISTPADLEQMKALADEIHKAAQKQALINTAFRIAGFLAHFAM